MKERRRKEEKFIHLLFHSNVQYSGINLNVGSLGGDKVRKVEASWIGLVAFIKGTLESTLGPSVLWGHHGKMPSVNQKVHLR